MDRELIDIGGVLFDNVNMAEAVAIVEDRIKSNSKGRTDKLLLVANQDILNRVGKYKDLTLDDLNSSFLTIPDGYSIVYGAKFLGYKMKCRVTGPDLMDKILSLSPKNGYKHFFLGAAPMVAQTMADNFTNKYRGVSIVGVYSPPFGEFSEDENNKIISMINSSKADIVWVSFGCPKQEWWIAKIGVLLEAPVVAGVGAAFDFHSGNKKRAPLFIQKMRLEWFYRMMQEPKRLWARYMEGGIGYIKILFRQKKSMRRSKNS